MINTVKIVKTEVVFTFKNNMTYSLPLTSVDNTTLSNYCTGIKLNEKLYTPSNTSIIGNISSNTLSISIVSKDKMLMSNNENSVYYGYMNSDAIIDVWCTDVVNNKKIYMGRYWVDTWENANNSNNKFGVEISAVSLINKIKQISLVKVSLKRNITFKDYLISIINKLNSQLDDNMKVKYNESDLDIFNSIYSWNMYYNNIDRDNIEIIFNTIAQNSLSYIWIDRDGYLKTDCLIDDKESEVIASYSGDKNLFSYNLTSGDIYQYSGVNVKYIDDVLYDTRSILSMQNIELRKGRNIVTTNLNSNKVINIHHIKIDTSDDSIIAKCVSFFNYKNTIEMNIISSEYVENACLYAYGTIITERFDSITQYKSLDNTSSILDIENNILRKECINTYINGLVQLLNMTNGQVIIEGYISPAIRLDSIIHVYGKSLDINGYYKVIGLEYTLGSSYRCRATLIKTIDIIPNIDDLLYDDNVAVINMMSGINILTYEFKTLTDTQENLVDSVLGDILSILSSYL